MTADTLELFDDVVFRAARQGVEVEKALSSPIGALIVQRALESAHDALLGLIEVDAENPATVRRLQNEAKRAADICRWVKEVLDAGQAAEKQLRQEDGIEEDAASGGADEDGD